MVDGTGIRLADNSDNNSVINNRIKAGTGVNIDNANCFNNIIKNNNFLGSSTKVSDSGTFTVIKFNTYYITENTGNKTIPAGTNFYSFVHNLSKTPLNLVVSVKGNTSASNLRMLFMNCSFTATKIWVCFDGKLNAACKVYWSITG